MMYVYSPEGEGKNDTLSSFHIIVTQKKRCLKGRDMTNGQGFWSLQQQKMIEMMTW